MAGRQDDQNVLQQILQAARAAQAASEEAKAASEEAKEIATSMSSKVEQVSEEIQALNGRVTGVQDAMTQIQQAPAAAGAPAAVAVVPAPAAGVNVCRLQHQPQNGFQGEQCSLSSSTVSCLSHCCCCFTAICTYSKERVKAAKDAVQNENGKLCVALLPQLRFVMVLL